MTVQELIDQCDFYELVSSATKLTKTKPNEYKGLSPFTNEKTPSFFVNEESKTWYCFSTSQGGGIIDYVMAIESMDKKEAINFLAEFCGVSLDDKENTSLFDEAQKYFASDFSHGASYFHERGFSDGVAKKYGIGFCTGNGVVKHLKAKGFTEKEISASGLVNEKGNAKYYQRLTIPIKDNYGKIVSFTGRATQDDQKPKYLHGPSTQFFNKKNILWNYSTVRKDIIEHDMVVITEGQMDAMAVTEAGYPAVSTLGTSLFENQLKTLANLTKNIYFMFDSDKAGRNALRKAFDLIRSSGVDVVSYSIVLPGTYDPDDFIKDFGVEEFSNYIQSAQPDTADLIYGLIEKFRGENKKLTKTGLTQKIIQEVRPYVEEQFTYRSLDLIERMAQELGVNKKSLHDWLAQDNEAGPTVHNFKRINNMQFPAPIYERRLLYHLIKNPSLWHLMEEEGLTKNDFESHLVSKVVSFLSKDMTTVQFIDKLKEGLDEEEYNMVMSFYSLGIDGDFETAVQVLHIKKKEKSLKSPAVDFLGRPLNREEKDMTDVFHEKLFEEKDPF